MQCKMKKITSDSNLFLVILLYMGLYFFLSFAIIIFMKKKYKKCEEGWSFVETLIVMAIVLILTAAVGFSAIKQIEKARVVTAKSQIETFSLALDSYFMDVGSYPTKEQGLEALFSKPVSLSNPDWDGPYITKAVPKDPWGNDYQYIIPGENGLPYGISSLGKDGMEGGEGKDADIRSWE